MAYDVDLDEGIIEGNQKMPLCKIQHLFESQKCENIK